MEVKEGYHRGFVISKEAWYAFTLVKEDPEVTFGIYADEGGCKGEMNMIWHHIGQPKLAPRLEAFSDSWEVLASFSDLIEAMAKIDGQDPSVEEFIEILKSLGFKDDTPRTRDGGDRR